MKVVYLLSVILLLVSFLCLKKSDKKESIITYIIFSICLLFCFNTFVVYLYSLLGINGSFFSYSIFNIILSIIFIYIIKKQKLRQKYYFKKEELIIITIITIIGLLIGIYRFRGLNAIAYESVDASIHYLMTEYFSKDLNLLNDVNSKDIVYNNFSASMPAFYINGGFLINIFNFITSYKIYMLYDIFCYILISLLFVVTLFKIYEKKKNLNYFYITIISLLYSLGFPLNNFLFGFGYLGIGIMSTNLLLLSILLINDLNKRKVYNIIIFSLITLNIFNSYYLFVPCLYLSLGLYFINLYKKKKIDFKTMMFYGIFSLVLIFIIGFCDYILEGFLNADQKTIFSAVKLWGYIYNNKTPLILMCFMCIFIFYEYRKKNIKNYTFFDISFIILSLYIYLFIFLYIFKLSEIYYLYKLFYIYWIYLIIILCDKLIKKEYIIYIIFILITLTGGYILVNPTSSNSNNLKKLNIFNWNARLFDESRLLLDKNEITLMKESKKYADECIYNDEFILYGWNLKNYWYYSITKNIPITNHTPGLGNQLEKPNKSILTFNDEPHKCAIYYNESGNIYYYSEYIKFSEEDFEILYENESGVIVKKNEKD